MGLAISDYIHVDDTGARHQGENGVCTHIGRANRILGSMLNDEKSAAHAVNSCYNLRKRC